MTIEEIAAINGKVVFLCISIGVALRGVYNDLA